MKKLTRRDFMKAAVIIAATILLAETLWAAPRRRPNVVIMFTDDQGTLDANCYGSEDLYTPTMDKLAATGVRFAQAYAHTVCCPARAALMTGRHPQRCGVNSWTQERMKDAQNHVNMFQQEITIAEILKQAGYKTALFGKWHLGAHIDHGPTKLTKGVLPKLLTCPLIAWMGLMNGLE